MGKVVEHSWRGSVVQKQGFKQRLWYHLITTSAERLQPGFIHRKAEVVVQTESPLHMFCACSTQKAQEQINSLTSSSKQLCPFRGWNDINSLYCIYVYIKRPENVNSKGHFNLPRSWREDLQQEMRKLSALCSCSSWLKSCILNSPHHLADLLLGNQSDNSTTDIMVFQRHPARRPWQRGCVLTQQSASLDVPWYLVPGAIHVLSKRG